MPTVSPIARDRLQTPIRNIMRPGVITIAEHASLLQAKRAMVAHRIHAVMIIATSDGRPLGWVTASSLLQWLDRDLSAIDASHAVTERPRSIEPDATARDALELFTSTNASHLLVMPAGGGPAHGVVAPIDLVDLMTQP